VRTSVCGDASCDEAEADPDLRVAWCAGKTTLARHLAVQLHAVRLSPDEWMAHLEVDPFDGPFRDRLETLFWVHTQELLRLGQSVILESGFWLRSDRDEKRLGARALGVPVELRYRRTDSAELLRRVQRRNVRNNSASVRLDRQQLEQYAQWFEAPDDAEMSLFDQHFEAV
jgi:predicted kinase